LTSFAFLPHRASESDETPLGPYTWLNRRTAARVPVFKTGTPVDVVIMTLLQWGLEPEVGDGSVVVREGPSRHNLADRDGEAMVYGFGGGLLDVGPLNESEMVEVFMAYNLGRGDYGLLLALDAVEPLSAGALNNMAWSLSTWHDASRQAPSVALDLALRANERSGWTDPFHLDTLAAAYAVNGKFRAAAVHQQWAAVAAAADADPEMVAEVPAMLERLELYKADQVYVEPENGPVDPAAQALYEAALGGDAADQWAFAAHCLEAELDSFGNVENPGTHFLRLAAEQGELFAVEEMGFGLLHGDHGLEADPVAARVWLDQGIAAGSGLAAYNLAMMHLYGIGVERDDERTTHWLRVAADRGVPEAAVEVAYRYLEGVGTDRSPALADEYFARAAAEGIGPLEALYGRNFSFDEFTDELALEALPKLSVAPGEFPAYLLGLAANMARELEQGQPYVTARLPDSYVGWEREDAPMVIFLLTLGAADYGSREAQERVADAYEHGDPVDASAELAEYWRARAAKNAAGR
jgi:TPR repeat protein